MNTIRILLIEDSPSDALLLESLLAAESSFRHTLTIANRLAEGLTLAAREPFDIALLDMELPDSHGKSTFEAFHDVAPRVPGIVLTRRGDMDTAVEVIQKGAQDFLPKSELTTFNLCRAIRYAIERQQLVTQLQQAVEEVNTLGGLLPICGSCKSVRDDKGYWNQIEIYLQQHAHTLTHGLCPKCVVKTLEASGVAVPDKMRNAAAGTDRKR